MYAFSFNDFAERHCERLQAEFFFTSDAAATPRIPVGERQAILRQAWDAALDAVADRLRAWCDPQAPSDKTGAAVRHLHLLPGVVSRLPQPRIEACVEALVRQTCRPDLPRHGSDMLADLTADLL